MSAPPRLLADAAQRLAGAGVASPRVDAELLLAHTLGVPRSRLAAAAPIDDDQAARFEALVRRRVAREPTQHIVGRAPFRHLELAVGPGVFVPRPETELLVDAVLPWLAAVDRPLVVDLGAGSGALALAIAHEVPSARVIAVELSAHALRWLRGNAAGSTVEVVAGDLRDPALLAALRGSVDVVVSNPPYVPHGTAVEPEVRADPDSAVFAGPDGLALMPAVLARAADLLRPGGRLAVEHDESHPAAVLGLLRADRRWDDEVDHVDLAARPRFATAHRTSVT